MTSKFFRILIGYAKWMAGSDFQSGISQYSEMFCILWSIIITLKFLVWEITRLIPFWFYAKIATYSSIVACFRPTVSPRPLGAFRFFFELHVFYGRFSKTSSYLKWFTTGYNFVHFFSRNILVWCHEIARWFWSRLHSLLWYSPYSTLVTIEFSSFTL